mmetsp:Transcript_32674/g.97051  ORF Transcript_32674/g.97051 Transcript_32674/m.97051 type:complete len:213 (+) Transcript_32674:79-717(+)
MGEELLLRAAQYGDVGQACLLLDRRKAEAKTRLPPVGTTPLHAASRSGNLDMVELLLRGRADPNVCEVAACGGKAPLHLASRQDCPGVVLALLEAGANPGLGDASGQTPLHLAAQEGKTAATRILLECGADPHLKDNAGMNAAWWAKEYRHAEVLEIYAEIQVLPDRITAKQAILHAGPRARAMIVNRRGGKKKKKAGDGDDRSKSQGRSKK